VTAGARGFPLVSAHRGGGEAHRPATSEAYRDAVTSGAEFAELDVRRLGDGTLVVFHDACVAPSGPALGVLGYPDLCAAAGYEVPRVPDVLGLLAAGGIGVHLDLKEVGYEADVVDLTERYVGQRYVATTLEDSSIRAITARYPHARAALSLGRDLRELSHAAALAVQCRELFPLRRLRACGATGIAMHQRLARRRLLSVAHTRGLESWVWTVDDDDLMRRFLTDPRVTVLVTNRPHRAVELRAALAGGRG
jgi:glycerophosphoryl diester phosphodiesterase